MPLKNTIIIGTIGPYPMSIKLKPLIICSLAASFYVYEFMLRVMPSAMTHELMSSFHIHASGLGLLASLFFWGYTPMQLPAGLLYDRCGPRTLLSLTILLCAICTIVFGMTHSITIAAIARFGMGFTAAFAFIGALITAAHWFPPKYFAFYAGLVQFLGCMGAIIGQAPIAWLTRTLSWRETALLTAGVGIIFSIFIWTIIRDYPKNAIIPPQPKEKNQLLHLKQICTKAQTWWVGLYGFFCWAPVSIFATLWGVPFLMSLYHFSPEKASFAISFFWWGIALGSPIVGWWTNHICKRRLPLTVCSCIGLIAALCIIYGGPFHWLPMALLLLLFGSSASAQCITFGLVLDNNADHSLGTAVSFNNMAVIGGGIIFQPLVGYILAHEWSGKLLDGIPSYSVSSYHLALSLIPLCYIMGLIISNLLIRETRCLRNPQT